MSRTFYLRRGNKVRGPVTTRQIREMATSGTLHKTDQIRVADQEKWYMAGAVKGLFLDEVQSASPTRPQTPILHNVPAPPVELPTANIIAMGGFEGDRKLRRRARRKRLMLWAGATTGIAIIGLVAVLPALRLERAPKNANEEYNRPDTVQSLHLQAGHGLPSRPVVVLRDQVVHDTPLRAQIEMHLVIDPSLEKADILAVLEEKYEEIMSRRVFKHHEHANSVWIYAFASAEYERAYNFQFVAAITKPPANEQPTVDFDDQLYARLKAKPEVRHGLAEIVRREIFKAAIRANLRAYREADDVIPTEPEQVLSKGDIIVLSSSLTLMAENNSREWFETGARSMELPPGSRVEVLQVVRPTDDDSRWAQVAAYAPGEETGYAGWVIALHLGLQQPEIADTEKFLQRLNEQQDFAVRREAELLTEIQRRYDIAPDVLQAISDEGHEKMWPWSE